MRLASESVVFDSVAVGWWFCPADFACRFLSDVGSLSGARSTCGARRRSGAPYAMMSWTTLPCTSVNRKSRPL